MQGLARGSRNCIRVHVLSLVQGLTGFSFSFFGVMPRTLIPKPLNPKPLKL